MKYHPVIIGLALLLALCSCTDRQEAEGDGIDLVSAWVLRHVEYPSGMEEDYSLDSDGTVCLIYDRQGNLYQFNIATTPTGLLIQPREKLTVTLANKGGGEWLYLENGDPHPLSFNDTTITIQRNGIRYTWMRNDRLHREWGDDIRELIDSQAEASPQNYVLSARERQQASYIQWLLAAVAVVVVIALSSHLADRRRRRQLQLQLRQIQEVQENRPQPVRQAAKSVEDIFFASGEYVALCRRMATGQVMKDEEWPQVEQSLMAVYPGFAAQLLSLYPMSDVEYHASLLIKLRIPTKDIAAVLAREVNTISTMRKRLYKKVFNREGGARDWDNFILSIDC